jgi:hypothetical protein
MPPPLKGHRMVATAWALDFDFDCSGVLDVWGDIDGFGSVACRTGQNGLVIPGHNDALHVPLHNSDLESISGSRRSTPANR